MRYHARSWTLVIEPDGNERATTWSASVFPLKTRATSGNRDPVAEQLRTCLQIMAAAGLTITYGGLARLLELSPPNTIHQITTALEHLMEEDAEGGRPFIAALVISKREADCRRWASLTARGASAGSPAIPMEWRLDLSTQPSWLRP